MIDRHHPLFTGSDWTSRGEAKQLRTRPSLVIPLEREVHEALHRDTVAVPLLGYHALRRTIPLYEPGRTPVASVENLMTAIEQAVNHPQSHIIEKHLAELSIWALELQLPYLKESPGYGHKRR